MSSVKWLITIVIWQHTSAIPRVDPLVDSKVGLIKGLTATDGDYSMFLGIPYAKVDDGNPFGISVPYPKFEDTFEAFDDTAICPQLEEFNNTIVGTLDCLHLNVYVPNTANSRNRRPVLVWIYGGALRVGFAGRYIYGPKFLVRHNIILVTLNYRLGPYGFMCLDIPSVPGNQGFRDQQLALRWVKDNVEAFGGDADKITIFGESAGSMSVDFHIHTAEENLFHQAILQSGVIFTPGLIQNPGNDGAFKLAEHLGFVTNEVNDALSFLGTVDTNLIIAAGKELGLVFEACVEQKFDGVEPLVSDYPIQLKAPNIKKIRILIGCNNDEELISYANVDDSFLRNTDIIGNTIKYNFDFDEETYEEMIKIVKHFYFGDRDINEKTRREVLDFSSDFRALHPTQRSIKKYFEYGASNIFSYIFSYSGDRNFVKYNNNITFGGAAHMDEISYLFDVSFLQSIMSESDQIVVDRITSLWTNFAKYGDPTPETTDLLPVKWRPASMEQWNYLNIDKNLTLKTRPFSNRMAFLDLFFRMNEKYLIGYRDDNEV